MTVNSLWGDLLILALFLLIGFFIRESVKPLQKLFLPSSLIGGLVLLLLGPQFGSLVQVPETFRELPGLLIDAVMASLIFGVSFNRKKLSSYLDYACLTMTVYGMQMCVGVLLGWFLTCFWSDMPPGWGVMGTFSFHGGHGTAAAAASSFEKLGIQGNMSIGMVLSTFGLVIAMMVGMIVVNLGVRKGWGTFVDDSTKHPDYYYGGILPESARKPIGETVTSSISINHLALQAAWLLASLLLGKTIFRFIGSYLPSVSHLPSVLHGVLGGALLWNILKAVKLDRYVDLKTIKTISGFLLEIIIFTAIATLDLKILSAYIVPLLIYTIVLCTLTLFVTYGLAYLFCREEWFEKACMAFGAATGNTSTGLALVRAIDPDSKSSAGDTHSVYSTIMCWKDAFVGLAPIWLMSGISFTVGIGITLMVIPAFAGWFFFARKKSVK